MTRRAAAGLGRLLPLLLIAAATLIVTVAAVVAACGATSDGDSPQPTPTVTVTERPSASASGAPSPSPSASATQPTRTTLGVYFLRGEKLGVAERRVPSTSMPATAAVKALLAGPTPAESTAGLATTVPKGTRLLGLTIDGTTARVDLSGRFAAGGGTLSLSARIAQVVYTLTRFRTVRSVEFLLDGRPVDALGGEGIVLDAPQRRADWRDFEPVIFVESPGAGAAIRSPFALTGTASVYEGSFVARLVDASGRRVVNAVVQATRGAPGRGTFARKVPFSTSASAGTLIVYSQSMEDGSRQNEVRIPVTFAAD